MADTPKPADDRQEDDALELDFEDILDFEEEEVLDLESMDPVAPDDETPSGDVSEVTSLDFLDDEGDGEPIVPGNKTTAGVGATTKFSSKPLDLEATIEPGDVLNIDGLEDPPESSAEPAAAMDLTEEDLLAEEPGDSESTAASPVDLTAAAAGDEVEDFLNEETPIELTTPESEPLDQDEFFDVDDFQAVGESAKPATADGDPLMVAGTIIPEEDDPLPDDLLDEGDSALDVEFTDDLVDDPSTAETESGEELTASEPDEFFASLAESDPPATSSDDDLTDDTPLEIGADAEAEFHIDESNAAEDSGEFHITGLEDESKLVKLPEKPLMLGEEEVAAAEAEAAAAQAEQFGEVTDELAAAEAAQPAGSITEVGEPVPKKSAMPMILLSVLGLLAILGGIAGGLYATGMLPGFGDSGSQANKPADGDGGVPIKDDGSTTPKNATTESAAEMAARKLDTLLKSATAGGMGDQINESILDEAEGILTQLKSEQPEVAADELVVKQSDRLAELRAEVAESKRLAEFRTQFELAAADAPMQLNEEALAAAEAIAATDDERTQLADLRNGHEEYVEQQALAAAEQARTQELTKFPEVVADAAEYQAALERYAAALPDEPRGQDFARVAQTDPEILTIVNTWNDVASQIVTTDLRRLPTDKAAELIGAASGVSDRTAMLPAAELVEMRLAALRPMAARVDSEGASIVEPFSAQLTAGAGKVKLVLATKDGQQYYLLNRPQQADGKFSGKYLANVDGTQGDFEIELNNVDRAATGQTSLSSRANKLFELVTAVNHTNWEQSFVKSLLTIEADEGLDPVVKAAWLSTVLNIGTQGSKPLAEAFSPVAAKLAETGVDADFNWADPAAANAARSKCTTALDELPALIEPARTAAAAAAKLAPAAMSNQMLPAGVLMKDDEDNWRIQTIADAPSEANLFTVTSVEPGGPLAVTAIGQLAGGEASFNMAAMQDGFLEGRVVYAIVEGN